MLFWHILAMVRSLIKAIDWRMVTAFYNGIPIVGWTTIPQKFHHLTVAHMYQIWAKLRNMKRVRVWPKNWVCLSLTSHRVVVPESMAEMLWCIHPLRLNGVTWYPQVELIPVHVGADVQPSSLPQERSVNASWERWRSLCHSLEILWNIWTGRFSKYLQSSERHPAKRIWMD